MTRYLLEVAHLKKWFPLSGGLFSKRQYVKAVNDVSFKVPAGKTMGVVGESGCGKSTLGRAILRLVKPTGGTVRFNGKEISNLGPAEWKGIRRQMQMIFQDSYASLNPRMRIGTIIEEPLKIHRLGTDRERKQRVAQLLETVGLPRDSMAKYPHEFSGGQRQRIDIARALVLNPQLVVCDEPVSALDVSIQSQVINLLRALQETFHLTYLFISHDLSVIRHISDHIAVMYLGKIVEISPKTEFFIHSLHPYSQALLSAVPIPDPDAGKEQIILEGDVPSPVNPPSGCHFRTRCPFAWGRCERQEPSLYEQENEHFVACHKFKKN